MTIYHAAAVLKRAILSVGGGADDIRSMRGLAWGRSKCDPQPPPPPRCPETACNKRRKPKKGLFSWLFGKTEKEETKPDPRDTPEIRCCCRKYLQRFHEIHAEPDFSEFGGQAYKTCGIAYIIQRDRLPTRPCKETKEDRLLKEIETHPDLKGKILREDPVKETENMYGRLLEMADKGLHPMYKKISATPPSELLAKGKSFRPYRAVTGPIDSRDVPAQVVIDWTALDKKNITWAHKRIQEPKQLVGRLIETKLAYCRKGLMKFSHQSNKEDVVQRDAVFDTLKQKKVDFFPSGCQQMFCREEKRGVFDCREESDDSRE